MSFRVILSEDCRYITTLISSELCKKCEPSNILPTATVNIKTGLTNLDVLMEVQFRNLERKCIN